MITLTNEERDKFVVYLKQEAETNKGIADLMKKAKTMDAVTHMYVAKSVACMIVARDLGALVEMSINKA